MENKWIETYYNKLEKAGINHESVEKLIAKYGDAINNASYSTTNESGMAYDGSLIEIALTKLASYAVKINSLYPENLRVDINSVVKVCLLQHISKAIRAEKSTNEWRVKNLGEVYRYVKNSPAIGTGLHSLAMAVECGIEFNAYEVEAMTINDRADDDLQAKFHCSMLSSIVKQANEMVYIEANKKNNIIK